MLKSQSTTSSSTSISEEMMVESHLNEIYKRLRLGQPLMPSLARAAEESISITITTEMLSDSPVISAKASKLKSTGEMLVSGGVYLDVTQSPSQPSAPDYL